MILRSRRLTPFTDAPGTGAAAGGLEPDAHHSPARARGRVRRGSCTGEQGASQQDHICGYRSVLTVLSAGSRAQLESWKHENEATDVEDDHDRHYRSPSRIVSFFQVGLPRHPTKLSVILECLQTLPVSEAEEMEELDPDATMRHSRSSRDSRDEDEARRLHPQSHPGATVDASKSHFAGDHRYPSRPMRPTKS